LEVVLEDVYAEPRVKSLEEFLALGVRLRDDRGALVVEVANIAEGRAEHGVARDEGPAGLAVELREPGLDRGYVGEDAVGADKRQDLPEDFDGVSEEHAVDHHLRGEIPDLGEVQDAPDLDEVLHPRDVGIVDADLVVEAELLGEPRAHPPRADYLDAHGQIFRST